MTLNSGQHGSQKHHLQQRAKAIPSRWYEDILPSKKGKGNLYYGNRDHGAPRYPYKNQHLQTTDTREDDWESQALAGNLLIQMDLSPLSYNWREVTEEKRIRRQNNNPTHPQLYGELELD